MKGGPAVALYRSFAPAKLNLYLHVVGRRDDGYHLLDSLVAFADLGDMVAAEGADTLSLELAGPFAAALEREGDNLVLRAVRLLAERLGRPPAARLRLVKNLPVASGIGGGSSDAAATLRVLARLWRSELPEPEFFALAARLGADVPVCLGARAAWLGGIGEHLEPGPALPECGLLLVNPVRPLATPDVFKARAGPFSAPDRFAAAPRDAMELAALLRSRRNDLTEPAQRLMPEIAAILARLEAEPGALLARMSGSGATCFALFADAPAAAAAAARIAGEGRGWWVAPPVARGAAELTLAPASPKPLPS